MECAACNPSTWEAETGGPWQVLGEAGLYRASCHPGLYSKDLVLKQSYLPYLDAFPYEYTVAFPEEYVPCNTVSRLNAATFKHLTMRVS